MAPLSPMLFFLTSVLLATGRSGRSQGSPNRYIDPASYFHDAADRSVAPDEADILPAPQTERIPQPLYTAIVSRTATACVDVLLYAPQLKRYLLLLRDNPPIRGLLAFIGGRMFKGESFFETAARKVRGECGLTGKLEVLTAEATDQLPGHLPQFSLPTALHLRSVVGVYNTMFEDSATVEAPAASGASPLYVASHTVNTLVYAELLFAGSAQSAPPAEVSLEAASAYLRMNGLHAGYSWLSEEEYLEHANISWAVKKGLIDQLARVGRLPEQTPQALMPYLMSRGRKLGHDAAGDVADLFIDSSFYHGADGLPLHRREFEARLTAQRKDQSATQSGCSAAAEAPSDVRETCGAASLHEQAVIEADLYKDIVAVSVMPSVDVVARLQLPPGQLQDYLPGLHASRLESGAVYLLVRRQYPPFKGQPRLPGTRLRRFEVFSEAAERAVRSALGLPDEAAAFAMAGVVRPTMTHFERSSFGGPIATVNAVVYGEIIAASVPKASTTPASVVWVAPGDLNTTVVASIYFRESLQAYLNRHSG